MHRSTEVSWRQMVESGLGWIAWEGTWRGVSGLTFGHPSVGAAEKALWGGGTGDGRSSTTIHRGRSPGHPSSFTVSPSSLPDWYHDAQRLLLSYCDGDPVELTAIPLDVSLRTPFAEKVVRALLTVGYGKTISYAGLAELAGSPNAARAVGTVMSHNAVPLIVPCHRVVGAGGRLGGYSAPRGLAMKRELLEMEAANSQVIGRRRGAAVGAPVGFRAG